MPLRPLAHEQAFERRTEILEQMPAIRDLDCLGCAACHTVHDGRAAVATDKPDQGMRREPGRNRRGRAVGQDIERGCWS